MTRTGRLIAKPILALMAFIWLGVFPGSGFAQSNNGSKTQSDLPVVQAIRITGDAKKARFVMDVSDRVGFSAFALAAPHRLVIDLPSMSFEVAHGMEQIERGPVSNFRFGVFGMSRSRIVLDLSGPVRIGSAKSLPPVDGNPARLVIEIEQTSEKEFSEIVLKQRLEVKANGDKPDNPGLLAAHPLPKNPKQADPRPLVVLDPGHGGIDTGAVSRKGLKESRLVLAFAKALKKELEKDGQVRVVLTREKDEFVSLSARVAFAQARHADLFVSIHADSVVQRYVRGATVYTLSDKASDKVAEALAKRENRSDLLAGLEIEEKDDTVADILIDLTRRETANHSMLYSRTLVGALKKSVRLSKTPQRSAGFRVLKAPDIPSVLLELGYLSNDKDQADLGSKSWQQKAIKAITASIHAFFARRSARITGVSKAG